MATQEARSRMQKRYNTSFAKYRNCEELKMKNVEMTGKLYDGHAKAWDNVIKQACKLRANNNTSMGMSGEPLMMSMKKKQNRNLIENPSFIES